MGKYLPLILLGLALFYILRQNNNQGPGGGGALYTRSPNGSYVFEGGNRITGSTPTFSRRPDIYRGMVI